MIRTVERTNVCHGIPDYPTYSTRGRISKYSCHLSAPLTRATRRPNKCLGDDMLHSRAYHNTVSKVTWTQHAKHVRISPSRHVRNTSTRTYRQRRCHSRYCGLHNFDQRTKPSLAATTAAWLISQRTTPFSQQDAHSSFTRCCHDALHAIGSARATQHKHLRHTSTVSTNASLQTTSHSHPLSP